jgi:hypothetical protein
MKDFVLEFRTNNLNRVADMMAAELDKKKNDNPATRSRTNNLLSIEGNISCL